ncbi:MAG: hypothetical protein IPM97_15150 [Bdellovibrionaceae bacterium]|nr:hypothetical protein [Pseudobdellovibrionaceae bacterium]
MKHQLVLVPMAVILILFLGCTKKSDSETKSVGTTLGDHEDPQGFYTCPMHPQVHEHKPGKCPICHMNLVKVSEKNRNMKPSATMDTTTTEISEGLSATDQQLRLAGISKYTVVKKDLVFTVPASGRLVSSREVNFQVYETDLQIIKAGLDFSGIATSNPEESLSGKIRMVDNMVDPSSRTVRVMGTLNKSFQKTVMDGGFHGEITSVAKNQIVIPEEAVLHAGKKDLVYLISKENGLKSIPVQLGRKSDHEYQVLSGLNEGDVISTGPNFLIDSEAKIRGTFELAPGETKSSAPSCPPDQHWDIPMSMCMPGEARK